MKVVCPLLRAQHIMVKMNKVRYLITLDFKTTIFTYFVFQNLFRNILNEL